MLNKIGEKMNNEFLGDYRKHKILARFNNGSLKGRVWDGEGIMLIELTGNNLDGLITELKDFVDSRITKKIDSRSVTPEVSEYVHAFQKILEDLPESYLAMLKAHYFAPDRTLTATQLANATRIYKDWNTANLHYGLLGKRLHDELLIQLPKLANGKYIYTFMLATEGGLSVDESQWQWKMRPEVAKAIEQLGLFS